MAEVINSAAFDVADGGSVTTTGDFDNTASIDVDSSDGQSGGVLTIGGTLTNSGSLNIGTNVENGSTTVNIEGADGVNNTGTIDLSDDRSPGSTNQATLDVANAAAGFGVAGQVTGTVSLVGDSLIEFASGGITQVDAGASLSLAGGELRLAIIGTNTAQNTALSGLAENDGAFSVADDATVTTTVDLNNTANIYVDNSDGESGGDAHDRRDADQQRHAQHRHQCRERLDDGERRGRRRREQHRYDRSRRRQVAGVDQPGDARCGERGRRLRTSRAK